MKNIDIFSVMKKGVFYLLLANAKYFEEILFFNQHISPV
jgi:hypothetical protein